MNVLPLYYRTMKKVFLCIVLGIALIGLWSLGWVIFAQWGVEPLPTLPIKPVESQQAKDPPELPNPYDSKNWQTAWWEKCDPDKDIMLNISIPFIGRCIKKDPNAKQTSDDQGNSTVGNVFPKLMWGMIRLVMTAIYIIWFLWILVGWFMIAASGADPSLKEKWKSLIIMIIWWLILLWASWVILNLINPNFFWVDS